MHDGSPLGPMGLYPGAVAVEGDDVGDLVGDGAGEKVLPMARQQGGVVAHRPELPRLAPDLTRPAAPQVAADLHPRGCQTEVPRRALQQGPGAGPRQGDERLQGLRCGQGSGGVLARSGEPR